LWEDNNKVWSFSSSSSIVTTFFPYLSYIKNKKKREKNKKIIREQLLALEGCCLPGYDTVLAVGYV
jgi:hypothetical protein